MLQTEVTSGANLLVKRMLVRMIWYACPGPTPKRKVFGSCDNASHTKTKELIRLSQELSRRPSSATDFAPASKPAWPNRAPYCIAVTATATSSRATAAQERQGVADPSRFLARVAKPASTRHAKTVGAWPD